MSDRISEIIIDCQKMSRSENYFTLPLRSATDPDFVNKAPDLQMVQNMTPIKLKFTNIESTTGIYKLPNPRLAKTKVHKIMKRFGVVLLRSKEFQEGSRRGL